LQRCDCYGDIQNSGGDRKCDQTSDGFKIHGAYYGGSHGTYLIEVPAENLRNEMLKELYLVPRAERPAYWAGRNIPEQMRGLWWTDYNYGLTSFLHNTGNEQVDAGHLRTTTKVWGQNVWSWDSDTLYKLIVKPTELKYQFDFYQQCPATGAATCTQGGQPGDYRWASITPIFTRIDLPADAILNRLNLPFTMRPVTDCNMCADQQHTIKQLEYTVTDADVATGHFNCAQSSGQQDTCWRRETGGWTYDLIKVVDQYGDQIADRSTLAKMVGTNKAYSMARTPVIRTKLGVMPNPNHRVVTDDIGWGLCTLVSIAERLEAAERDGDLWLVVVVLVQVGPRRVQTARALLVGVRRQCRTAGRAAELLRGGAGRDTKALVVRCWHTGAMARNSICPV